MIEARNLTVHYNSTLALNKFDIQIRQGEKISIIGKSGCGKTTLLHALAGILEPTEGEITFYKEKINKNPKETSIILQKDGLFPWKTVRFNVFLGIINEPLSLKEKHIKVDAMLEELGIAEQKEKYLHELSGGQRQRVAIARGLIQQPKLLLMDEPTSSLDMITKENFQDSLHELYKHHKITAVLVTHDIEEAAYLGQRILIMDKGKVIGEIENPYFSNTALRDSIEFYQLCLRIRQVMKHE
jgi:NitT/TauT family transport system ATP-binding protein